MILRISILSLVFAAAPCFAQPPSCQARYLAISTKANDVYMRVESTAEKDYVFEVSQFALDVQRPGMATDQVCGERLNGFEAIAASWIERWGPKNDAARLHAAQLKMTNRADSLLARKP